MTSSTRKALAFLRGREPRESAEEGDLAEAEKRGREPAATHLLETATDHWNDPDWKG